MVFRIALASALVLGTLGVGGSGPIVVGNRHSPVVATDRSVLVDTESATRVDLRPLGAVANSENLAAEQSSGAEPAGRTTFRWPVDNPVVIVRPFDSPPQPWLAGHRGVDLSAPPGSSVQSPASGVVTFIGKVVDRHLIVIDHGELRSTLEPAFASVALGELVSAGQQVGVVSDESAHAPGVIHWGVRRGNVYINPTLLVDPRPRAVLLE